MNGINEIDRRVAELYGEVDWRTADGVLHVAAIAEAPRVVIAIGAHSPASATDRFVLGFARARCDAIVTTGAVLRAEPELVHRMAESPDDEAAFVAWREQRLGRACSPQLVVLSNRCDFSLDHPALRFASGGFVWTSEAGRARLGPRIGSLEVVVAGRAPFPADGARQGAGVSAAIEFALARPGVETLVVEAGPSTSSALYPDPLEDRGEPGSSADSSSGRRVDELLLSRFEGELDARAAGPGFVSESAIASLFQGAASSRRLQESSGDWLFQRYRRST